MNRLLRLATVSLSLAALAATARAADAGYIDMGKFTPVEGCQFVEVNIGSPLLKFASCFVDKNDADAAALMRAIKHVRVNVIGYNDASRAETAERVATIRREVEAQGWERIVTAREPGKAEDVVIYVKMRGDEEIQGLVVTVIGGNKDEAVIVNLVGNIKPEQLAALGANLKIDALSHLKVTVPAKDV